jgi:hypothetical protein
MSKPKDERALSHCDGCGEDLPAREVTAYFHLLKSATPPQLVDVRASIHLCEECAKNAEDYLGAIFESDEITDPREWGALLSWLKDEQAEEPGHATKEREWAKRAWKQVASWEAQVKANPPQRVIPEQSTQAGEAQIKTDPPAQDHPRTLSALIELAGGPGAFLSWERSLPAVIASNPQCPVIVRTTRAMFICAASDVPHLEQCLLAGGEAVRVVAFLTLQEQNPVPTPPK